MKDVQGEDDIEVGLVESEVDRSSIVSGTDDSRGDLAQEDGVLGISPPPR